ncbi:MAG TPA: FABP family protein [Mycobacterium sp.]|nr:MAG: FABP family protein [Mycobacterium sp.]HOB48775.1 FABP family protein [Mycobacterium sp.]HPZ95177.1 FABP family protein [Mycobacterium sp.]HQE14370.1 FABP family protein [Mycobacterium sp.]
MPDLHPGVAVLAPLLGTWVGRGSGDYPTIEPFGYLEEITFGHTGKPFLVYSQRTRSEDGQPMHAECGYLRSPAPGRAELILAQPTGVTEIDEGTITVGTGTGPDTDTGADIVIELRSTAIGLSSTAKDVAAVSRMFRIRGDELTYRLDMSAVGQPMTHHLTAGLQRKR